MYDGWKIIVGLIVFIAFVTLPFTWSTGKEYLKVEPKIDTPEIQKLPEAERKCVESKEFMRKEHMKMLIDWRDAVVRDGKTLYVNSQGKSFNMSLQNTCMQCHTNKSKFCDECHNYVGVKPYCWDCHIEPKENIKKEARL
ncbi:MAG: sulfate reduction electron transfer complex DsrMKJOP subunit DsrJ [Thermodesulfovibrio sp.]|nr:sulfate reduction electron transfer complex DsrMKJOP subunit DsrJ [Thermodesulfovibrio sp.]